jgi:hypothetical protein
MQVDSKYGIIPDTQKQILDNYLSFLKNVFPNANSPDDPTYVIASICSYFDELNQSALEALWNTKNSDTASGIGLDILSNTVLNLFRKSLTPSSCVLKIVVQNLLSFCDIQIDVTVASPQTIPIGWAVSGTVSPSPAYASLTALSIPSSGVYTIRLYSTDVSTIVPISAFNAGTAVPGVTFITVSNPGQNVLGTLVIPTDWAVTASSIPKSPIYTPNQYYTYTANGTYYLLLYSTDILTDINIGQLNTFTQINNINPTPAPMIASITNLNPNVLGSPAESDAQFAARRRYYLNIEGQTYYGLEKVILNINAPALKSVFVSETITDNYNASICIIKITVTVTSGSVVIPINWTVYGTAVTLAPYKTQEAFSFTSSGEYYIPVFSIDGSTAIPIGNFTSGDVITGVVVNGNLDPAILNTTIGLGQRGYTIYLNYPAIGPGVTFDIQDVYLQQIASACFEYHPLGTQFYSGGAGNTNFTVKTPYSGYIANVILNPLIISEATVHLTLVYNVDPEDAGFSNGIFPVNLITGGVLKTQLIDLINAYFNSKTLPTDLVFSINELSELIQAEYTGIVALNSGTVPFTFGTISPSTSNVVFLRRPIGYVFNLTDANFNFNAVNKS